MADPFKDGSGNFTYGYIVDEANVLKDNGLITTSATETYDYGSVATEIPYSVQLNGIEIASFVGLITQNVSDLIAITGLELASVAESIYANGVQTVTHSVTGLDLTVEYGNINQIVEDSIFVSGLDLSISIQEINANGIQSPSISIEGLELSSEFGEINEQVVDTIALSGIQLNTSIASITAIAQEIVEPFQSTGGEFVRPMMLKNARVELKGTKAFTYIGKITPFGVVNGNAIALSVYTNTEISDAIGVGQLGIDEETLLMLLVA